VFIVPLLIIPIAIYNVIAFIMTDVKWDAKLYTFRLMSGAEWSLTFGDALVVFSLLLLLFEIVKAARHKSIVDHLLSTLVFVGVVVEFLMVDKAANSTFVLLVAICFIEMIAGYSISFRRAPRSVPVEHAEQAPS
jgi:hypothetical protein